MEVITLERFGRGQRRTYRLCGWSAGSNAGGFEPIISRRFEMVDMGSGTTNIDGGNFPVFAIFATRSLESSPPLVFRCDFVGLWGILSRVGVVVEI